MTEELLWQAMEAALAHYWIQILVIAVCAFFSIRTCIKEGAKGDKYAAIGILLIIVGLWTFFDTTIPLTREYARQEVAMVEGIYNKSERQSGGRYSRASGMETVTVKTETETLVLTTYPWNRGEFPDGSFPAVVYYTPNTEFLLQVEILNTP